MYRDILFVLFIWYIYVKNKCIIYIIKGYLFNIFGMYVFIYSILVLEVICVGKYIDLEEKIC